MSVPTNPSSRTGATTTGGSSTGTAPATRTGRDTAPAAPVRPRGHVRDDLGLLVIRIALAAFMIAHGLQKVLLGGGLAGTQQTFAQQGIPLPDLAAIGMIILELAGGVAILFGLLTPLVGLLYAAAMAGSIYYVHLKNGFFATNDGYELAGLVGLVALALAIGGAGRLSLDRAIFGARRRRRVREARDAGLD